MFYLDSFLHLVGFGIIFIIGAIVGVVIGYLSYDHAIKTKIKPDSERRIGDNRRWKKLNQKTSKIEEEQRTVIHHSIADIRAPSLDSAGIVIENEEVRFNAHVIDISRRGIAILAQQFLKVGLTIDIAFRIENKEFAFRRVQVRNITLLANGLRIGMEFSEPFEDL